MTLEIHEAAVTKPALMKELRNELRQLNIGLAFDDFGAGQARLGELFDVLPDYLKFDMSLIRNIDKASVEQIEMVRSLVQMVRHMNIVPLAEGIESTSETQCMHGARFRTCSGLPIRQARSTSRYLIPQQSCTALARAGPEHDSCPLHPPPVSD